MGRISISRMRKISVITLGVYILVYYVLIGIFSSLQIDLSQALSDIFSLIGEGAAIMIIVFGFRWQKKENRIEWLMFSLGIGMNAIGDFIWSIYEIPLKLEVPFPSVCDVFYLCGSLFYLLALVFYIRSEKLFDVVRTGFDILITMVVSTTIIFNYVMLPIWNDNTMTFLQKSTSLAYPIFDLGYLGGIFSIFFFCAPKSKLNRSNLLISTAFLIWLLADMFYAVQASSTYVSGGFIDPLWPIGCWVLAFASLHLPYSEKENTEQNVHKNKKHMLREYIRFLFPYFSVGTIVMLVSYQYILKDPLIAGTSMTVLLIMVRQIFTLFENKRLIHIIQKSNKLLEDSKSQLEEQNIMLQKLNSLKEREANTDFLTGMFNRRYVNEALHLLPKKYLDNGTMELSVLLIDIDHYKNINDQWGHEVGDIVLQKIAYLIKSSIRSIDIAGRFGGDEFIVILPNTNLKTAKFVADRLRQRTVVEEFLVNEVLLKVTLSIGCVRWRGTPREYDMSAIVVAADKALYQAKEGGRNQCKTEDLTANLSSIIFASQNKS